MDELDVQVPFRRARTDLHKSARSATILQAGKALLTTVHPLDLRMRALANVAGISPSGIYRYFENLESVLLHIHLEDLEDVVTCMETTLHTPIKDVEQLAGFIRDAFLFQPRFLRLFALTPAIYERELSVEGLINHKRRLVGLMQRAAASLLSAGMDLTPEAAGRAFGQMLAFALGLHPLANPSPNAQQALSHAGLESIALDMGVELHIGLQVIIRGQD